MAMHDGAAAPPLRAPLEGISVVVPALDEEDGIGPTLTALHSALAGLALPWEVVVVDDGSRDRTAERARAAGARVLSHPQPGGYGHALRTGIRGARYDGIVLTDADGTYPVETIPGLIARLADFDLVIGARTGPEYMRRALLSPVRSSFLMLARFVTGTWLPDPNSGLRAFRRTDILPILDRLPRGFSFTTTQTLIFTLEGRFLHYERIPYRARIGRSKVRVFRDALRVGQGLVEIMVLYNPLKVFLAAALPAFLLVPPALLLGWPNAAAWFGLAGWLAVLAGLLAVVGRGERLRR